MCGQQVEKPELQSISLEFRGMDVSTQPVTSDLHLRTVGILYLCL